MALVSPKGLSVVLDDDAGSVSITGLNGNSVIVNNDGIKLKSSSDIELDAAGDIILKAAGNIHSDANEDIRSSGANVSMKAHTGLIVTGGASAEISASGQTVVKGSMVMIN